MRHHSYSLPKKINFPKFADGQTEKEVTPKDPLRINARNLKTTPKILKGCLTHARASANSYKCPKIYSGHAI